MRVPGLRLLQRIVSTIPTPIRSALGVAHFDCSADGGINPLFDFHAEEAIIYTEEMKRDLKRREHRPDRIIGLCQTPTVESLLEKPDRRHPRTVEQTIRTSPFKEAGEPVMFPFLVMEAKSDKSTYSFGDIDMQTAFAIRELVILQEELEDAASRLGNADWEAVPLVWYFSYRGEQWRLHGAFPRPHGDPGAVVCSSLPPFFPVVDVVETYNVTCLLTLFEGCGEALERQYRLSKRRASAVDTRRLYLRLGSRHVPGNHHPEPRGSQWERPRRDCGV